jgi:hypothetical protein
MFRLALLLIAIGNRIRRAVLFRREKELLGSCADCDRIRFLPYDDKLSIEICGCGPSAQNVSVEQREYIDAFLSLSRLDFFMGENEVFRLTTTGRTRAQNLAARGFRITRCDPTTP